MGDTLWNKAFSYDSITSANKIIKINNGYLIGGYVRRIFNNYKRMYFLKLNNDFDSLYSNIFDFNKNELLYDIKKIGLNKFVLSASQDSSGGSIQNGLLRTFDSLGNIFNEKILPTPDDIDLFSILLLGNGDIVFAGEADFNVGDGDIYIVRTDSLLHVPDTIIGIKRINIGLPTKFKLYQNFPNPFNPSTKIKFDIPQKTFVSLKILNILGQEIIKLVNEELSA
ncbi:MAG TPA: hypothetical protein VJ455_10605, partial [Ignavibacteria bacterium]|nr:hypothetical protein [Ignavibacteria bacterium]